MSRNAWYRRHPRATLLALGIGVGLLLDLAVGALLIPREHVSFRRPHPVYHHGLWPSQSARAKWGRQTYHVHTNSLGFRDGRIRDVPLETSRHRILILGDSFVEGIGMEYDASFVGLLDAAMQARAGADGLGQAIEILNAGVIGYSPKLYALKLRYLLEEVRLQFDELYVFIDNSDIPNEIIYESWQSGASSEAGLLRTAWRGLKRRSYTLHALGAVSAASLPIHWNAFGMPFASDLDAAVLDDPEFRSRGRWTEDYKYAARGLALATEHMDELVRLCRENDIALTIVVYPWLKNILYRDLDHVQVRFWRRFSDERDVNFVELYSEFIARVDASGASAHDFFIPGDAHWNTRGHAFVAERLLPRMGAPPAH